MTYMLPFMSKKSVQPPLGLMTVAALIPETYTLKLVDVNVSTLNDSDLEWADLVMISAMIIQKDSFDEVTTRAKQFNKKVVAGGPYCMSSHEKINNVDYFVLGEAEVTLPLFMKDYENGNPKNIYDSGEKPQITTTPPPRMDLINHNDYLCMAVQFSRGCPFNCEFCDIIEMFGRKPRTKDADQFINELQVIYDSGFRGSVFIVDDNFIGNIKQVKAILRKVVDWQKEHDYPFQFYTEASINVSSDTELLQLMQDSSFDFMFIGIESPDVETLRATQKGQNTKLDMVDAVETIYKHRVGVAAGFIIGFDTDDEDIFDKQIDFISETGIPQAMIGLLIALPNTQLHRRLKKEGRLLHEWSGNNTYELELNFVPKLPEQTLVEGYKRVIATLYEPRKYFDRCLKYLRTIPPERVGGRKVGRTEKLAFFKSLFKQSFSFYGKEYLRYFFKGMKISTKLLPDIISYAINGHHFIRMTREFILAEAFINKMGMIGRDMAGKMSHESLTFSSHAETKKTAKYLKTNYCIVRKRYKKISKKCDYLVKDHFMEFEKKYNDSLKKIYQINKEILKSI